MTDINKSGGVTWHVTEKGNWKPFSSPLYWVQDPFPSVTREFSKCKKVFTQEDNLKKHEETHNVEKIFHLVHFQKPFHQNFGIQHHECPCPSSKLQKTTAPLTSFDDISIAVQNLSNSVNLQPTQSLTVSDNSKQEKTMHGPEKRLQCVHCQKLFPRKFDKQCHKCNCPLTKVQRSAVPPTFMIDIPIPDSTPIDVQNFF